MPDATPHYQLRFPTAGVIVAAFAVAAGGCAHGDIPRTNPEAGAGTVMAAAGAVGGGIGGAALGGIGGFAMGIGCGPAAVICAPVMGVVGAAVGGVSGAIAGARGGGRAGVRMAREDAAPAEAAQSADSPVQPLALASPDIGRNAPGLPPPGTTWTYRLQDRQYGRGDTAFAVHVLRTDGTVVEEAVNEGDTRAESEVHRAVDAREVRIVECCAGARNVLVELAPYWLSSEQAPALAETAAISGYPLGGLSQRAWRTSARVLGWDQVDVPAGRFRALRVEVSGHRAVRGNANDTVGRFLLTVWYAPDVKRLVRLEHKAWSGAYTNRGRQIGEEVVELVSYRPPS